VVLTPRLNDYQDYKFVGDVDGFGWSGRFRDLMRIGSVIAKSTAFPEWFSPQLIPWYHYGLCHFLPPFLMLFRFQVVR
jgi:hypothetical protein